MSTRYLFNCISHPQIANTLFNTVARNRIERNPGDMAYAYSIMNALAVNRDVEFVPTGYYYFKGYSDRQIDKINSTCSKFILPLANLFCAEFAPVLESYARVIRKLKIPVVVPCVGTTSRQREGIEVDHVVKNFINAVLDHSPMIGVRGESTASYLSQLGFVADRHFVVLGCPSMYTYGPKLRRLKSPDKFGRCAVTLNQRAPAEECLFIDRVANIFNDKVFISQYAPVFYYWMVTNKKLYRCLWESENTNYKPEYISLLRRYAENNQMRFFMNRKPWQECLSSCDFYIGHRIHGLVMSILAGTPSALVPFESRTEELATFHSIPMIRPNPNMSENSLREWICSIDYSTMYKRQGENFDRYLKFLHLNGLNTVFDMGTEEVEFPLEDSLPTHFPDDDVRAYPFNSNYIHARMALATTLGRSRDWLTGGGKTRRLASKLYRMVFNRNGR